MTDIFWPDILPSDFLAEGLEIQPQNNVVRTAMDAGPKKARRRYTARSAFYSGKQRLTTAEYMLFEQFYHTVLADGVLRFNFTDPVTEELCEFRFTGNYTAAEIGGMFEVTMPMERMS